MRNEFKSLHFARKVYGHKLFLTRMRLRDDYLIMVTNLKAKQAQAIEIYTKCWEIRRLFGC